MQVILQQHEFSYVFSTRGSSALVLLSLHQMQQLAVWLAMPKCSRDCSALTSQRQLASLAKPVSFTTLRDGYLVCSTSANI